MKTAAIYIFETIPTKEVKNTKDIIFCAFCFILIPLTYLDFFLDFFGQKQRRHRNSSENSRENSDQNAADKSSWLTLNSPINEHDPLA